MTYEWPGVVVVGGGASGLVAAHCLAGEGVPVLLLESQGLSAGQTGHCHGYLHRGYIYRRLSPGQESALRAGADWWRDRMVGSGVKPVAETSVVAFDDPRERAETVGVWERLGMPFEEVSEPALSGVVAGYRVPEWTVSPGEALRAALPGLSDVAVLRGRATAVRPHRGSVDGIDVRTERRRITLRARRFVLAAGLGLPSLLGRTSSTGLLRTRMSFMLVCHTRRPVPDALCLPFDEAQGLFVASRPSPAGTRLLMSTFVSFWPGEDHRMARELWLGGAARSLARHLPSVWSDPDATWGVYTACKTELAAPDTGGVPEGGVLDTGWDNAWAVAPGKLVLAPHHARECAHRVLDSLDGGWSGSAAVDPAAHVPGALPLAGPWAPEDWEMTVRFSRRELFRSTFQP